MPVFDVHEGDTVRWWTNTGFATGHYVRHNRKGRPVVRQAGKRRERAVDEIYPVNDGRMVARRGRVEVSGYNDTSTTTPRKRGRK